MRRSRVAGLSRPSADRKKTKLSVDPTAVASGIVTGAKKILGTVASQASAESKLLEDEPTRPKHLKFYSVLMNDFDAVFASKRSDLCGASDTEMAVADALLHDLPMSQSQASDAFGTVPMNLDENSLLNLVQEDDPFEVTNEEVAGMSTDQLVQQCRLLSLPANGTFEELQKRVQDAISTSHSTLSQDSGPKPLTLPDAISELVQGTLSRSDRMSAAVYVAACEVLCQRVGGKAALSSLASCSEALLDAVDALLIQCKVPAGTFRILDHVLCWDPPMKSVKLPATATCVSFSHFTPRQIASVAAALDKAFDGRVVAVPTEEDKVVAEMRAFFRGLSGSNQSIVCFGF